MPMDSLAGRHFLILGGSTGMGFASAEYLVRGNGVVTICGRDRAKLTVAHEKLVKECASSADNVRSIAADATLPDDVEAAFALAANASGEIDGVFVVAGAGAFAAAVDTTPEIMHSQITINLIPVVNAIRSAVPRMKAKGGSILAMSSAAALCSYPNLGAYGAAKAALDHYVRVAADELGQYKIRVNAVRSGFTNTPVNGDLMFDEHYIREFNKITPLGPYAEPEQFGPISALLMSPESSWITGAIVPVDGGLTLRGYGGGVNPSGM
jgi:NAD(P)-dependent dehydrogenase (short-subunit alcohol dehydrogenase family)